ncbi:MAG TPA: sigma-54 dependent transcriptional regulator [Gemmatimonadaceae bacterium]
MNVLVVDDELGLRQTLTLILQAEGHDVRAACDGGDALRQLAEAPADIVLCDVRMPQLDGLAFLERYGASGGGALVIMMSAYGDDDAAVEAIRRGAYDFISKPFRADQVLLVLRKAIEREGLRREVAQLHHELNALRAPTGIVGRSPQLAAAIALADKVARHPSTVLITGESGTGKELVARHIHRESPRAAAPFVAVNCGAIPETLLESELFGHTKGAFTGATADRDGLFADADGGTLFLDELGELPPPLQVKLLRALQEGEVRRVGDNAARKVDVRVVAATSRDLESDVAAGRFRADLYYRVNVVRIHLPPLRERTEDVPELVRSFIDRFNARLGLRVTGVSAAAMRALIEHPWPGNVRELENTVERAMVLTDNDRIDLAQLPTLTSLAAGAPASATESASLDLSVKRRTDALERMLIREALARTQGNRTRAARLLDLSHRALLYKIREYGIGD